MSAYVWGPGWRRAQHFLSEPDLLISGQMFGLSCVKENYSQINSSKVSHTSRLLGHVLGLTQVLSGLKLQIAMLQWVLVSFPLSPQGCHLTLSLCWSTKLTVPPWPKTVEAAMETGGRHSLLRQQWALLPKAWCILGKAGGDRKAEGCSERQAELWPGGKNSKIYSLDNGAL